MPIYDYKCEKCLKEFEIEHKMHQPPDYCDCGNFGKLNKIYVKAPNTVNKEKNSLLDDAIKLLPESEKKKYNR